MSTSKHEPEWTGVGKVPTDDDFAAALEREHSATERMLRGDSAEFKKGHLAHRLLASGHSGDLGYSFELVTGRVRFVGAEIPVPVAVRVTHVWRQEADGWKLLHRHADQLLTKVEHLADIDQSWLDDEQPQLA